MIPGPCVVCGGTNYGLSCGGPTICPKCDCGHFDAATVLQQAKVIASLREEIQRLKSDKEALATGRETMRDIENRPKSAVDFDSRRIARNCDNWSGGVCQACGVQWQNCEVHWSFACPRFVWHRDITDEI